MAGVLAYLGAACAMAQTAELPNRKEPLEGITTAGQPSAAAFAAVADEGYRAVIDLRGVQEDRGFDEKATVEGFGMSYVALPVNGPGGVTFANAAALDKLLGELPRPVLVHCSSGNRAGALLALRAKLAGADDDAALALGVSAGLAALKPVVEQKLAQGRD
jgi:uncharacterized protein (TIGR01244 family)